VCHLLGEPVKANLRTPYTSSGCDSVVCRENELPQIKDLRYCCSVHSVLESLLHFRSAPSIRPRAKHAEQHRHSDVYPEPGAAQLCCEPSHLLPLLHAHVQDSQVHKSICRREIYHC
jgi:hypothetical protein